MVLILIGIGCILIVFFTAVAVEVIWKVNTFAIVGAAIGGILAHTTGGVIRNYQVDGPVRQMQAQAAYGVPPPSVQQQQGIPPLSPPMSPPPNVPPPPPS